MTRETIKIAAVGDISLGDEYLCYGKGVRAKTVCHGPEFIFKEITKTLHEHDIVFGNLEGVLSDFGFNRRKLSSCPMRGIPESANALKNAGFNVLSLANNHIMQHGQQPVVETVALLKQNGISGCGLKDDFDVDSAKCVITIGDVRIGFLAYNDRPQQHLIDIPLYKRFRVQEACSEIESFKPEVDLLFVSLHWGDEFCPHPSHRQQEIAHRLVESGADVILGHHPHVVQGIEAFQQNLVFYSLGNFVFDLSWYPESNRSFIVSFQFKPVKELNFKIIPVEINHDFQPVPLLNSEKQQFFDLLKELSKPLSEEAERGLKPSSYEQLVKEKTAQERILSHQFWLKHISGFPKWIIVQYVWDIVQRRFDAVCKRLKKMVADSGIPVLMYHDICTDSRDESERYQQSPYFVSPENFAAQMDYLHRNNYKILALPELLEHIQSNDSELKEKKFVVISFDDGYEGVYQHALPVLKNYGFTAVLFVIVERIGNPGYLTWQQLQDLDAHGIDVQSHTLSHRDMELLSRNEIKREIRESKALLEKQLQKSVEFLSFPQGSFNRNITSMVADEGYYGSFTSEVGFVDLDSSLFEMNRIHIRRDYTLGRFAKIIRQNRWFFLHLKWNHGLKRILKKVLGVKTYGKIWLWFKSPEQSNTKISDEHSVSFH